MRERKDPIRIFVYWIVLRSNMFGNILVFNKHKVEQYSALILGKVPDIYNDNTDADKTIDALLRCSEFEKLLQKREDFYDFTGRQEDCSIQDVRISSIIRATGEIHVPEQFDIIHLINEYKEYLLSNNNYKDVEERELLNLVIENSKMKVPIFCELGRECDYWLGIGKISHDDLLVDYNNLEDYEGTEVTIIARLESRKYYKGTPIPVYDIYKDFLGLNRLLRKQVNSEKSQGFENITVDEDYLGLELLAIYC